MPDADDPSVPAPAEDLALLTDAAEQAADLALSFFRRDPQVWHKENASPVSEADYAVDRMLRTMLLSARPGYGWLSEETEDDPARLSARRVFVVDPIDGTRGFLAGSDEWTISLAIVEGGRPTIAALIQPATGRLFTAVAGEGAWVGSRPLAVIKMPGLVGARIAGPTALVNRMRKTVPGVADAGYVASLALRIALVADGRLDLALARENANDWDIAAADLVLSEAGGILAAADGRPIHYNRPLPRHGILAAAHPNLARHVTDLLSDAPGPVHA